MRIRDLVVLGVCAVTGCVIIALVFAAVFNGLWTLLALSVLLYPLAAAAAVGLGTAPALLTAVALVSPALPWLLWLLPATIVEAGLLRASLWPTGVGLVFGLAWLAGALVARWTAR